MVGFQSPCVYIWLILFSVKTNGEDVDVLVLLPKDNSYLFSISMVRPAIEYAKKMIKLDTGFYSGLNFSVQYENSGCGSNALFSLVDRAFKKKPDLILGPVCEYAAADVVRMASHWDIPVISAGALAVGFKRKEGEYSHLTRIAPSYLKMAEIFSAMFHRFKWQNVLLVFDDDKEERNCYFTAEAVHSVLEPEELSMSVHVINSKHYNVDTDEIMNRISESEAVVIMCAGNDIIRDIMLAAYWRKLTNASYIYFSIELFNSSSYGNGSWKRGDRYDSEAKQAFASLNTVTLLRTVKPEFESFSIEMMKSVNSAGVLDQYSGDNMNVFMEGFHDALHLYTLALHDIMKNGSDKKDGKQITQNMWNRTFEGIAGQVSIDSNGDRNGDFSVMTMMDPEDGIYKAVLNYFGANGSLQTLPGFSSNRFTLTEKYETPNPDKSCGLEVSTVTCISVGAVMSTLLVMAVYFFRKKYKIIIERQCQQEQHSLRKHHHLREDTIAFSMA